MSAATCGTECKDGPVSTELRSRRDFFLHGHARRPALDSTRRPHRHASFSIPRRYPCTAVTIDAIVVLPDHLHAIFTLPTSDKDFSGHWRRIKGHFSSAMIEAGLDPKRWPNGELALWQRRFWEHTIRDDRDFARHVDYVHFNPVKHGLAPRVCDWPFSSFHRYVREGILPEDWAGDVREGGASYGEPVG